MFSHSSFGLVSIGVLVVLLSAFRRWFRCPPELQHLPRLPILPLLWSFLRGETESSRVLRLLLPFASAHDTDIVLVWVFGTWYVHVLDFQAGKTLMEHRGIQKQLPPKDMLFWHFVGFHNIFFSDGLEWKKHSNILRPFITRSIPMDLFCRLSHQLCELLKDGGKVSWSDLAHRITLDAVGSAVFSYDFNALGEPEGPFVSLYHRVMHDISKPLYVAFPSLERWLPRRVARSKVDALIGLFNQILEEKRMNPGQDYLSSMLQAGDLSPQELQDNTVSLFMAGHDTTAGALTTLVYYLAIFPEYQNQAREEVVAALGRADPTERDFEKMPFLQSCVREAMRINNPSTATIPRIFQDAIIIEGKVIPPQTPIMLNIYANLNNPKRWYCPDRFLPSRFSSETVEMRAWTPFGQGTRQCPARNFAMYEQSVVIAFLLRDFQWFLPRDSIHRNGLQNSFSAFALNLPERMDIILQSINSDKSK